MHGRHYLKIAYLSNVYPAVSHTFIRREIAALEDAGVEICRFSIRRTRDKLVDESDRRERDATVVLLDCGVFGLVGALLATAMRRPSRFASALRLAVTMGWRGDRGVLRHIAYLAEACRLAVLLHEAAVQHLHVHFGTNPTAVASLCRALGGPSYSFTVHGPDEFDSARTQGFSEKIGRASFVVAITEFCRSQLYRWCMPDQWHKVVIVHCGIDADVLARPFVPIAPICKRLVCVGRLSEQKGHLLLVEAARRLADEGVDFELVLVGDGKLRSAIEWQMEKAGIQDRIRITGWASNEEVREELMKARCMVLPSFAEGLPVVIMEAMAMGRPVISTYVAGIPELLKPGQMGWLTPAGCVEALVDAMRAALTAPVEDLNRMGLAGMEVVRKQHNASREADKLLGHIVAKAADGETV